jgi:hypothetical protein
MTEAPMFKHLVNKFALASARAPAGMGAFLAGALLLAAPLIAMVGSTTLPTQAGHWIVLLIGLALMLYGALRGIEDVS